MLTMTSDEIDYVAASFKAWCAAHGKPAPDADDALAYFTYAPTQDPTVAEFIDGDWDDFQAFLRERRLISGQ